MEGHVTINHLPFTAQRRKEWQQTIRFSLLLTCCHFLSLIHHPLELALATVYIQWMGKRQCSLKPFASLGPSPRMV